MVQDLLNVIERETAEDSQTTPQPNVLSEGERTHSRGGNDERSETGSQNNAGASEQGSTNVKVFLLLGSCANKRNGAHHGNGVETGTSDEGGRGEREERSDEGSLCRIEGGPQGILGNVAIVSIWLASVH